jgi:hypothetical protein
MLLSVLMCMTCSAQHTRYADPDFQPDLGIYKATGKMYLMPAIAVVIPLGIISAPNGEQDIIQPGTTFLTVNRLQITDQFGYNGILAVSISGNAATATELASTPAACPTGQFATGIQQNGAANCSASFPTIGTTFQILQVSGDGTVNYAAHGAYVNYNLLGSGETDFVDQPGSGNTAFNWYVANSSGVIAFPIMTLSTAGQLFAVGGVNGNATTATMLAGTPTGCAAGNAAVGIQANGDANCIGLGSSVERQTGTGVCTTGSSSYDTCDSSLTWPTPFSSAGYAAICFGKGATDGRAALQGIVSQSTTGLTYRVVTEGSVAVTYASVSCVGVL